MEPKKILIMSIIIGLIGAVLSYMYLQKKEKELVGNMNPVNVLVAGRDISQKSLLTADMFKTIQVPEKFVEPTAILINDATRDIQKVLGYVNLVPILAGQQIMQSQLVPPTEETGIAVKVPIGKRAIIIPVMNVDVADLVKPGDYVDVLNTFTAKLKTGNSTKVTITVLQNVQVLSVSKDLGEVNPKDNNKKSKGLSLTGGSTRNISMLTMGLAVSPEEAQLLALAQAQGDINVTVRNKNDEEGVLVRPVDTTMFFQ